MQIRHFILMGVFLGAAAFLPNHAFAEENEAIVQSEPQNTKVHTIVSKNSENPMTSEKAAPVTPENANKIQGGAVQKPVTDPSAQQTVPKPVPKSPNKTNGSIEKVMPSLEKKIKTSQSPEPAAKVKIKGQPAEPAAKVKDTGETVEPAAKVKDTGQTGQAKPNVVTNKLSEVPMSLSSNQTNSEEETNSQPTGLKAKSEAFIKDTESSVSIRTSRSLALVQKPLIDKENKTTSNNRKNLGDIEIMNNPPQRTQSFGGQSNELFSPGAGTISFSANRFDWDEYFGLNLGQIYTSRQAKYCHQWINAPPSPPPQAAPFFLTLFNYM
ncbi:hypothetical protein [Neobacillus niacini]|uniref:hypothetical protein n=1 Tax=Neobacillus niacini TaxID=86668 RepID=UPI00285F8FCC|nr:hypothetical protein [Neobacillus niacini]MDR7002885.1 hypothetical protein [Neobacillus niacini]